MFDELSNVPNIATLSSIYIEKYIYTYILELFTKNVSDPFVECLH